MPDMMQPDSVVPEVALHSLPPTARFILRGDMQVARLAEEAFGVDIPGAAMVARHDGARAALWLGPDEWLLLAPFAEAKLVEHAVQTALGVVPHALVCVAHREVAAELSGLHAAEVLNAGCPLDLDISAFPIGMCTRTMLAKAQIVLWRTGENTFQLHVWRSFFPYVRDFLTEATMRL